MFKMVDFVMCILTTVRKKLCNVIVLVETYLDRHITAILLSTEGIHPCPS